MRGCLSGLSDAANWDVRGRILVSKQRCDRSPQPCQPFQYPGCREHGVIQGYVGGLGRPGTAGTSQRRSDMGDLAEVGGAQAIAVTEPFQAKVARRGHLTVSGKASKA